MISFPFTIENDVIHGLPVTWILSDQFVTNSILISIQAGSFYESDEFLPDAKNGVFHFLEHQVFNLYSGEDALALLNRYVSNVNALTSREKTCYYTYFIDPNHEIMRIMLRLVFEKKRFLKKSIEKEKNIIINEIYAQKDDPLYEAYSEWNKLVFQRYPVWRTPIGTEESVKQIQADSLHQAFHMFYHPKQSDLILLTNQPKSYWLPAFDILPSLLGNRTMKKIELTIPPDPDSTSGEKHLKRKTNLQIPYFMAGWKPSGQEFSFLDGIIGEMILQIMFGSISKVIDDWSSRSYIDDSFSIDWEWDYHYGCMYLGGFSPHPGKMVELITTEMKRRIATGIQKTEFNIMKQHFLANNILEAYFPREIIFEIQNLNRFGVDGWEGYHSIINSISWETLNVNLTRFMSEKQFYNLILLPG